MTTRCRDGRDGPFSDWLRLHPSLDSRREDLCATDIDMSFLRFIWYEDKKFPRRRIKLMMDLEVKTYGKDPGREQLELLFFRHQLLSSKKHLFSNYIGIDVCVWSYGQYVLKITGGDRPDRCTSLLWGRFGDNGKLKYSEIDEGLLTSILKFKVRPDTLLESDYRRHHLTDEGWELKEGTLFPLYKKVISRS